MNFNEIQAILQSLPDQQIMAYAQGQNPQVPQVLAQMESMRRASLRKAQTMAPEGLGAAAQEIVPGMAEGGAVENMRRNYTKRQERDEAILKEANRKRGEQMRHFDDALRQGLGAFRERAGYVLDDVKGMAKAGLGALIPDVIEENFARQQALRDPKAAQEAARTQAYESLMAQAEQMQAPATSGGASGSFEMAQGLGSAVTPAMASPTQGPPAPISPTVTGTRPVSPRPPAAPQQAAAPAEKAQVLDKINQQADQQAAQFAAIIDQMNLVRDESRPDKPNMDLEKKRAFYRGLSRFGAALATTGIWAQAGDLGLQEYQAQLAQSEAKMRDFKKQSLEIGLAKLDGELKKLGYKQAEIDRIKAEAREAEKMDLEKRKVGVLERNAAVNEREAQSNAQVRAAQAEAYRRGLGGIGGGTKGVLTYDQAVGNVDAQLKTNPMLLKQTGKTREQLIQEELMKSQQYVQGTLGTQAGAGAVPSGNIIDFNSLK